MENIYRDTEILIKVLQIFPVTISKSLLLVSRILSSFKHVDRQFGTIF